VGDHLAQIYEKRGQRQNAVQTYAQALAATRPVAETRGRLAQVAGGEDKISPLVHKAAEELSALRTVKLGKLLKENASAEFFVLLGPPNGASRVGARVEDVKFISGSEKLRPLAEALRSGGYPAAFPDEIPTKLLRRGTLSCSSTTGDCSFVLLPPDQVTSIN